FPGVMALKVAMLLAFVVGEAFSGRTTAGLVLIVLGGGRQTRACRGLLGTAADIGHAVFLFGWVVLVCYSVVGRRATVEGLHPVAIAAGASLVVYLPIYALIAGSNLLNAPVFDVALQAIVQGVLTAIVALLLYGLLVGLLGATAGAAFVALTPTMTALL